MVLVYSDLFLLTFVPMIMQALAGTYLWRIHKIIGRRMTLYNGMKNTLMFLYEVAISWGIFIAAQRAGIQPIEFIGIWVGFVFPLVMATVFLLFYRDLVRSFSSSSSSQQ
jgi:hypothetical protein